MNHKLILISFIAITLIVGSLAINMLFMPYQEQKPIKLAINLWSGYSHAFIAQELGIFKKNDVDVQLNYSEEYVDAHSLYQKQMVDGVFGTLTDAIYYAATDTPSKVVYITDYSRDGDVIVGSIKSFDEIKGQTIGVQNMIICFRSLYLLAILSCA